MRKRSEAGRAGAALGVVVLFAAIALPAQSPPPPTAAKAMELAALLQARKLEAFAAKVPGEEGRFVAARLIPNVQLLAITALHTRRMDMEYYLYNKDHRNAYLDLNSSTFSTERVVVDDAMADGLVALPGKSLAHDSVVKGGDRQTFDGVFADGRKRNDKRVPQEVYMKTFSDAEQSYSKILEVLIAELKKGS
jgi:hypothetical protein